MSYPTFLKNHVSTFSVVSYPYHVSVTVSVLVRWRTTKWIRIRLKNCNPNPRKAKIYVEGYAIAQSCLKKSKFSFLSPLPPSLPLFYSQKNNLLTLSLQCTCKSPFMCLNHLNLAHTFTIYEDLSFWGGWRRKPHQLIIIWIKEDTNPDSRRQWGGGTPLKKKKKIYYSSAILFLLATPL